MPTSVRADIWPFHLADRARGPAGRGPPPPDNGGHSHRSSGESGQHRGELLPGARRRRASGGGRDQPHRRRRAGRAQQELRRHQRSPGAVGDDVPPDRRWGARQTTAMSAVGIPTPPPLPTLRATMPPLPPHPAPQPPSAPGLSLESGGSAPLPVLRATIPPSAMPPAAGAPSPPAARAAALNLQIPTKAPARWAAAAPGAAAVVAWWPAVSATAAVSGSRPRSSRWSAERPSVYPGVRRRQLRQGCADGGVVLAEPFQRAVGGVAGRDRRRLHGAAERRAAARRGAGQTRPMSGDCGRHCPEAGGRVLQGRGLDPQGGRARCRHEPRLASVAMLMMGCTQQDRRCEVIHRPAQRMPGSQWGGRVFTRQCACAGGAAGRSDRVSTGGGDCAVQPSQGHDGGPAGCVARPEPGHAGARAARRSRLPARPAVPRRHGGRRLRSGLLLGAERKFWQLAGVFTTAAGYAGGVTLNPTYEEVCSGRTGHAEVVQVVFDPAVVSYGDLLRVFWEAHNPTQGMRQGNDVGTQYRSAIYYRDDPQRRAAEESRAAFQAVLTGAGYGQITTEIAPAGKFNFAEDYHQQYLAKVPNGYCGLGGTGLSCPVGLAVDGSA